METNSLAISKTPVPCMTPPLPVVLLFRRRVQAGYKKYRQGSLSVQLHRRSRQKRFPVDFGSGRGRKTFWHDEPGGGSRKGKG
jgi:hypothetical protein